MDFVRVHPRSRALNLTPLIDVVFLLIIFFMLTSSFREYEALELAMPEGAIAVAENISPVTVLIGNGGQLIVDKESFTLDTLGAYLRETLQADGMRPVVVMSTNEVSVQEVVTVVDEVHQAGGRQVSLSHWQY